MEHYRIDFAWPNNPDRTASWWAVDKPAADDLINYLVRNGWTMLAVVRVESPLRCATPTT